MCVESKTIAEFWQLAPPANKVCDAAGESCVSSAINSLCGFFASIWGKNPKKIRKHGSTVWTTAYCAAPTLATR